MATSVSTRLCQWQPRAGAIKSLEKAIALDPQDPQLKEFLKAAQALPP